MRVAVLCTGFLGLLASACGNNGSDGQDQANTNVGVPSGSSAPSATMSVTAPPSTSSPSATVTPSTSIPTASGTDTGAQPTASMPVASVPSDMGMGGMNGTGGTGGAPPVMVQRELLSQTGLYSDVATETLAEGVMPYAPRFQLWTDDAAKRRWVYIPPGTQIDNTNPDEWKFPIGTKLWKEFSRDGVRVETRLIEKLPEERAEEGFEGWFYATYVWNDDGLDAVAVEDGAENAKGTQHDVPKLEACGRCHDMRKEKPLGFSAVQLSHDGEGATLKSISTAGWLKVPATENILLPGDEATQEVLGYFHANCGHCHRKRTPSNNRVATMLLWLETPQLGSVEETPAYQALVNHGTESSQGSIHNFRVAGGAPDDSEIIRRITERGGDAIMVDGEEIEVPMPPLGTELVDEDAVAKVRAWIESLPPPPSVDAGAPLAP